MTHQEWIISTICSDCLNSPAGQAILNGLVGIGVIRHEPIERCILCGWPFADQAGERYEKRPYSVERSRQCRSA